MEPTHQLTLNQKSYLLGLIDPTIEDIPYILMRQGILEPKDVDKAKEIIVARFNQLIRKSKSYK